MELSRLTMGWRLATAVLAVTSAHAMAQTPEPSQPSNPGSTQNPAQTPAQTTEPPQVQTTEAPERRIPQQKTTATGALQGILFDEAGRPLPGVNVRLESLGNGPRPETLTEGDGIFRLLRIPPGIYDLVLSSAGAADTYRKSAIRIGGGEVLSIEVHLNGFKTAQAGPPIEQTPMEVAEGQYKELNRRPDAEGAVIAPKELTLPAEDLVFQPHPDRWNAEMPDYHRYAGLEAPYVLGHFYDPFNRNVIKGDKPIFGKTFFSFTGDSITVFDGRRLPVTSGQSTARPDSSVFFGKGDQFLTAQTFRGTFELFHGDTLSFRPVDWRIQITPAANLNFLKAEENQIVSPDVRRGTSRFDTHVSLQEAFGEVKLHDLGVNYDFANLRVGIQQFVSDFRGFIFADEQPGARLFGNLRSNRIQWNLAGFDLLEKNTNSGLNTFSRRGREVAVANVFYQDFLTKGYTLQLNYNFVRDNGRLHYDDNGFLVRPTPLGTIVRHRIDADYFGINGDGHIGGINLTNSFYQVLGNDSFNQIANRRQQINAQFAAVEASKDYSYMRYRASFLYASGANRANSSSARGFDSIVDAEAFAGGEFSFFNREGIRLTGTGVALTSNDSFLPDLRSSKDEGQSNFNNPGLLLFNVGADAKLTQVLKLVGNVNYLQFARTQALAFALQQNKIPRPIGTDVSLGAIYRPFLSDNIVITGAASMLQPGSGLQNFYTKQTLFSAFATVRFQF